MKESKKILYIISSIFFALVLFIYATSSSFQNSISIRQVTSETYSNTISNVPIDIKYDSERYFISGFTSEASVVLTGSNRVALSSEMQESTRKFHVVADLSNASEGTVEVQLKVENLPSGLSATVNPQKISVKIGKKASKKVPVKYLITGSQVAEDISITNVSLEHEEVTVNHVAAVLPSNVTISGNYSGAASLQAMDANGNVLPSVVTPFETTMKVTTKTTHSNSSSSKSSSSSSSSSK